MGLFGWSQACGIRRGPKNQPGYKDSQHNQAGIGNQDLTEYAFEKLQSGERLSPLAAFRGFAHSAACEITREFDLRGAVQTVTSGCNSGADAIGPA